MVTRTLIFLYAILSYSLFVASFLYALGFFANIVVPKSIDVGGQASFGEAIAVDLALLGLFAFQHSLMARPAFKQRWTRIIPSAAERSTYVLLSSLALILIYWLWLPIPAIIWQTDGLAASVLVLLQGSGWLIALGSTFMIDHFDLLGLKQGLAALRGVETQNPAFQIRWLYRLVRHPLMLGFLIAFWAAPVMTAGHLLFAIMTTLYVLVALQRALASMIAHPNLSLRDRAILLIGFAVDSEG